MKARRSGMGHTRFEMHLNTGRWWLAGRLSDHKDVRKLIQPFINHSTKPSENTT
jgi:hypothetical protein